MDYHNNQLNVYKDLYIFYREKCKRLESTLEGIRKLLNAQRTSVALPHSAASPDSEDEVVSVVGSPISPILGGNGSRHQDLHNNQSETEDSESEVDFSMVCGANKWECEMEQNSPAASTPSPTESPRKKFKISPNFLLNRL